MMFLSTGPAGKILCTQPRGLGDARESIMCFYISQDCPANAAQSTNRGLRE